MNTSKDEFKNRKNILDEIVPIKKEQIIVKKSFTNTFIKKLEDWLEKVFLRTKEKKEFLVTKESLTLELLHLLQSQKKFKDSNLIQNQICSLALFDTETNLLGKIINFSLENNTVEFITLATQKNNDPSEIKKIDKLEFFDPFSSQMDVFYQKQKIIFDCFNYKESFIFLTGKANKEQKDNLIVDHDTVHYSLGRGIPLDKNYQRRINNNDIKDI